MPTEREIQDSRRFLRRLGADDSSTSPPRMWLAIIVVAAVLAIAAAAAWFVSFDQTPVHNAAGSETLSGRVVSIADGDTFTLLDSTNKQIKIRLAEIDTPERDQPYASKAKQALSAMVFQKEVSVRVVDTDRYKRTVGRVATASGLTTLQPGNVPERPRQAASGYISFRVIGVFLQAPSSQEPRFPWRGFSLPEGQDAASAKNGRFRLPIQPVDATLRRTTIAWRKPF